MISRYQLVRLGLAHLIAHDPSRAVVLDVSAQDGHLGTHDVVIYDLAGLVDAHDDDLTHLLASGMPIVALEPHDRPDLAEGALAAGVVDVVRMDTTAPALLTTLERAASGAPMSADERRDHIHAQLMADFGLTEREVAVLDLIAAGITNLQVAERLYLSVNSIKGYVKAGYKKIGATRRSQAVLWGVEHGLGRS